MLAAPFAILVGAWFVVPALVGLVATFTNYAPLARSIHFVGLANYASLLGTREFQTALRNIAAFTLIAVPAELAIGLGLASLLRRPFRGRELARVLLLVPWLVSPIANGVMWHFLLTGNTSVVAFAAGALGQPSPPSPLAIRGVALFVVIAIEVWRLAPLATFLLLPSISAIPQERWEQASLDGLGWIKRIRHVAIPVMRPFLLAVTLLLIGSALGIFDSLLILTGGGPASETVTPALVSYQQAYVGSNWPIGATAAWLIGALVMLVGLVYLALARRADATA